MKDGTRGRKVRNRLQGQNIVLTLGEGNAILTWGNGGQNERRLGEQSYFKMVINFS